MIPYYFILVIFILGLAYDVWITCTKLSKFNKHMKERLDDLEDTIADIPNIEAIQIDEAIELINHTEITKLDLNNIHDKISNAGIDMLSKHDNIINTDITNTAHNTMTSQLQTSVASINDFIIRYNEYLANAVEGGCAVTNDYLNETTQLLDDACGVCNNVTSFAQLNNLALMVEITTQFLMQLHESSSLVNIHNSMGVPIHELVSSIKFKDLYENLNIAYDAHKTDKILEEIYNIKPQYRILAQTSQTATSLCV